jgi:hypothetical protein
MFVFVVVIEDAFEGLVVVGIVVVGLTPADSFILATRELKRR